MTCFKRRPITKETQRRPITTLNNANNALRTYENHPSEKLYKQNYTITSTFQFSGTDKADVGKSIDNLNPSKVGTFKNIPTKCVTVTSGMKSLS